MDAGHLSVGAAVNAKVPQVACFWATFSLSLLTLAAAFVLTLLGKAGSNLFLLVPALSLC